jgi:tetratricopeptide (TPR) repeat protein
VLDVIAEARVEQGSVIPILVVAQDAEPGALKEEAARGRFPAIVLHDPKREAFGDYRVVVVPSVVVVDGHGKVTYAMPGILPRLREVLGAAILVAAGKEPADRIDRVVEGEAPPPASPEAVRAGRLANLGRELARHGLYEMAEARYSEAMALAPENVEARQGLGELMLKQNRPADAEPIFRSILAKHPDSAEAKLGLATARLERPGDDVADAETLVRDVMDKNSSDAKAHYLMGRIRERQSNASAAVVEYRRAAEILLQR